MSKSFYRRHLPHFDAVGRTVFVTWNLKGSLPLEALKRIRHEQREMAKLVGRICKPTPPDLAKDNLLLEHTRRVFRISEDFLDRAEHGPRFLAQPQFAAPVKDALLDGAGQWYLLFAFVVMPNHVHALIQPHVALDRITMAIKRRTAKEINLLRKTPGQAVWQDESFDHFPRDAAAHARITKYIERNPVAAGLCESEESWPWSSAAMRSHWPRGSAYFNAR